MGHTDVAQPGGRPVIAAVAGCARTSRRPRQQADRPPGELASDTLHSRVAVTLAPRFSPSAGG